MRQVNRIPSLDGLRAVSILLVVLGHLAGTQNAPPWFAVFELYANFGVRVFFVISGYLITSLLLAERQKTGSISIREFYKRRCYRIFPAAYAFALVMGIVAYRSLSAFDLASMLTYTTNYNLARPWIIGHLWSLSVEEQFYLLWPFLLGACFSRRIPILLGTILIIPLSNCIMLYYGVRGVGNYFWTVADALAMGCLLSILNPTVEKYRRFVTSRFMLLVSALTLALPVVGSLVHVHGLTTLVGFTLMHIGMALTIAHCVRVPYWVLNNFGMTKIGVLSYSFYLWQQPFLDRLSTAWYTVFPVNIALAALCAYMSYTLVERPVLGLRDRKVSLQASARNIADVGSGASMEAQALTVFAVDPLLNNTLAPETQQQVNRVTLSDST